jgi:hypothetical protein
METNPDYRDFLARAGGLLRKTLTSFGLTMPRMMDRQPSWVRVLELFDGGREMKKMLSLKVQMVQMVQRN